MRILPIVFSALAITAVAAAAADSTTNTDKSQYTLFNPTPDDLLRPIQSGQADRVAYPFTVDAGHVQIEATLIDYYSGSRQGTVGNRFTYNLSQDEYFWGPVIRVGLLNNVEFEVSPSYYAVSTSQSGTRGFFPYSVSRNTSQFGDVGLAAKINLWGNDEGATALALQPYLSIPTEGGRTVVGGLRIPFAWRLPWDMMLKVASSVGATETGDGTAYVEFENDLALEKNVTDQLLVFCNLTTTVTTDSSADWVGYAGFGAAYTFSRNFQAYAGMRFGFEAGYDYNPYAGITLRF